MHTEDGVSAPALSVPATCRESSRTKEKTVCSAGGGRTVLTHLSAPSPLLRLFCSDTAFRSLQAHLHTFLFPSGTVRKSPGSRSPVPRLLHCCRLSRFSQTWRCFRFSHRSHVLSPQQLPQTSCSCRSQHNPTFSQPITSLSIPQRQEAGRRSDSLLSTIHSLPISNSLHPFPSMAEVPT